MSCKNCDPGVLHLGTLIKVTSDLKHCAYCGALINQVDVYTDLDGTLHTKNWDTYFYSICIAVASKSPCLSRKIGAVLVKDKSIVATGYNGPSRGIPHCGNDRFMKDDYLVDQVPFNMGAVLSSLRFKSECPRKVLGYESGTHMELCPAQHAEVNAISNAARLGVSVLGSTLYMNCITPCKNCFGTLINAGILEIVVDDIKMYDRHTQFLVDNSTIKIRQFNL